MGMTKTGYTLKGITAGRGTCDHCGRSLARLFRIATLEGDMVVGRTCAAHLTGYNWTTAQAETAERIRVADETATARYGDLYTTLKAKATETAARCGTAGAAGQGFIALRDQRGMTEAEAVAFAQQMLEAA